MTVENAHINADYMPTAQQNRRYLFEFITRQATQTLPASSKEPGSNHCLAHERLGLYLHIPITLAVYDLDHWRWRIGHIRPGAYGQTTVPLTAAKILPARLPVL